MTTTTLPAEIPDGALLLAWGTYPNGAGTFSACHARVLPEFITGPIADPLDRLVEVLTYGDSMLTTLGKLTAAAVLHEPGAPLPRPERSVKAEGLREVADRRTAISDVICNAAGCDVPSAHIAAKAVVDWLDAEAARIEAAR